MLLAAMSFEVATRYWGRIGLGCRGVQFVHVSTDEVYGALDESHSPRRRHNPTSPHARRAKPFLIICKGMAQDLLGSVTHASNNYGPFQYPEKLIPLSIKNALDGKPIGIYGNGQQIRDWLFVDDHVMALISVLNRGLVGQTYNIGGNAEIRNLDLIHRVCDILDELIPVHERGCSGSHRQLFPS